MFQDKTGKKFGSAFVAKRRDNEHDKLAKDLMTENPEHEAKESPEFEAGEQEGMKESPENVVAEHGKANTVHVAHDHKNKKHHVMSTHEDGHVHNAEHMSAAEAHNHAAALAGKDEMEAAAPGAEEVPEEDGFKMPRLA